MGSGITSGGTDTLGVTLRVRKEPHLTSFLKDQPHFTPLQPGKVGLCFKRKTSRNASDKRTWGCWEPLILGWIFRAQLGGWRYFLLFLIPSAMG